MGLSAVIVVMLLAGGWGLRVKSNRRLARPWLHGVPLPAWDDPRWEHRHREASLGGFSVRKEYGKEYGEVFDYGGVWLHGEYVGRWTRYAFKVIRQAKRAELARTHERLAMKALAEMERS